MQDKKEYRKLYRINHRKEHAKYQRRYRNKYREKVNQLAREWRLRNPEKVKETRRRAYLKRRKPKRIRKSVPSPEEWIKIRARQSVRLAVKQGKIIKKETCEVCGSNRFIQAHHDDYSFPLDIRWLCAKHHQEWHRNATPLMP